MFSYEEIDTIASQYGSPFYLLDEDAFVANYENIVAAFKSRYDRFILGYSYKTNYIPYLCNIIKERGGYAEVVSRLEYDLALRIGQDPKKIILNGPVKHYEDIELALRNESMVNLDSWYEVEHVAKYARDNRNKRVKIGLRINIGLYDKKGVSHIQERLPVGRFGFAPYDANVSKLVTCLTESDNVVINGLHGHTSTTDRSVWCYRTITETLCDIAARYLADTVEYINVGGGIFGHIPPEMRWTEVPSFDEYADGVCDVLKSSAWVRQREPYLILEPGVAMVANTLSFVTKVVGVKKIRDKVLATVDGSAFNTKPTFHKVNPPCQVIKRRAGRGIGTYSVVGSTCMEKDYLLTEITNTLAEEDDYIKIDNVGAYTVVLTPPFINVAPAIVVKDGRTYKAIRKRQSLEEMFSSYDFR